MFRFIRVTKLLLAGILLTVAASFAVPSKAQAQHGCVWDNGGYVTGSRTLVSFLRETSMMYIYSNPITPAEAAAAAAAVDILDSPEGLELLAHLKAMTAKFEKGLIDLGFETIRGEHPVTPLVVRDTPKTQALVKHLFAIGILATGLSYPVVPKGDEEIRFQVSADHTAKDIDTVLAALKSFAG